VGDIIIQVHDVDDIIIDKPKTGYENLTEISLNNRFSH